MLKNFLSLKARVASCYDCLSSYEERFIDERDDYVRVAFIINRLPEVEDSVTFRNNYRRYSSRTLVIIVKPDSFFMGAYQKYFTRASGRIFPKDECTGFVYVESRKVNLRNFPGLDFELGSAFLALFGLEGFHKDALGSGLIDYVLRNKSVVSGIVKGSITNWVDAWKKYCKSTYKIKSDFRLAEKYCCALYCRDFSGDFSGDPDMNGADKSKDTHIYCAEYLGIGQLVPYTKSWQKAVKAIIKNCSGNTNESSLNVSLYRDLLEDAFLLDKKVDLSWSIRRCREEHQRNIEAVMIAEECALSDEPIHDALIKDDTITVDGTSFRILNTERIIFREASYMHNCIHSHYYSEICRGQYLVLSTNTEKEGKIDIGYRWNGEKFTLDQIHGIRNSRIPRDVADALTSKVGQKEQFLVDLYNMYKKQPRKDFVREAQAIGGDLPF